ncbi:uncharacterized protein LOC129949109 [Eupeodes corollae]|uniref:uncharacterized protein LOC129949109 n=1 Tax=Eupeodes corollae TaxID=290404 RepID=UPI0024932695|nr:uncharacterized protein LOC129949109 [Eupeodes corollae]
MNPIVIFSVCLVLASFTACSGRPAEPPTVGKYSVSKSSNDDGKYRPVKRNEGRYIHMVQPYVHVHDNRELGQYVHIPNPYDGGYGPYSGLNNPYRHDESGNYDKYTVSNAEFEIPAIRLEYGFPDHDPEGVNKNSNPKCETSSTTTRRPTTTTTTTIKPRLFNYYEEGGWKILRQEEEKKKHKYDFLYHTENGIYGEEKAHLHPGAGTSATGYYEYTGDDGELYRVNYKSDHNGFIPEGDHIPTPPPVPDAIKRALEYVAKKKETHGAVQSGRYEHKSDPIRLQNMPTIDRPLAPTQQPRALPTLPTLPSFSRPLTQQPLAQSQPLPQQPRALPPLPALPTLAPIAAQPRFVQYSANNQYNPLPTIAPQNAPIKAYQAPSLSSKRPADQLIQQTQLNQLDQLPQVQVALPPVQALKPVELPKPVQVIEITTPTPIQEVIKVAEPVPLPELKPAEEQPQSDQPQADQPQADQPQPEPQPQQSEPEQLPKEEVPIKEEPSAGENLKTEQSIESIVIVKPDSASDVEAAPKPQEISPEASETDNQFQPPYQVPEQLTDEDNFELTMA